MSIDEISRINAVLIREEGVEIRNKEGAKIDDNKVIKEFKMRWFCVIVGVVR